MKAKKFVWLILFLIIASNVYADCHTKEGYQECIKNNQDFQTKSGDSLPAKDLQSYSGTVYLSEGSSAEMPENFVGVLVLNDATVKMPNGKIINGKGRCDKEGCTILEGEAVEGEKKVSNGQIRVKNDGKIECFNICKIIFQDFSIDVEAIDNLKFNNDGTFSFDVKEGSFVAGAVIGTAGTVVFDPKTNSLKPSILNPDKNSIFVIKSIDPTKKPITFVKDNVDIQLDDGMFLTKDSIKVVFKDEDCTDNCVLLTSKSIKIKGEGDTVKVNEENRIANVLTKSAAKEAFESKKTAFFAKYGLDMKEYDNFNFDPLFNYPLKEAEKLGLSEDQLKKDWKELVTLRKYSTAQRSLEISPARTGIVEIQNRNVYSTSGDVDIEKSRAPEMTVRGDESELVWAEIKDGGISLQAGKDGILNYRLARRGFDETYLPIELNILDSNGRSLIRDSEGNEIKVSINSIGSLRFSSPNAVTDSEGFPSCGSQSTITGSVTGLGVATTGTTSCYDKYFYFEQKYSTKAAIENAREEFEANKGKNKEFKPEYEQFLDRITLTHSPQATQTQIGILSQLPDYTRVTLLIQKDSQREVYRERLDPDIFSRITFVKVPAGQAPSLWAQDYSKGNSEVQILPLTYLGGGGYQKPPNRPENELIFSLESIGIEVRRVPIEFAGGNVIITKGHDGQKILLVGSNDYLFTKETYKEIREPFSEERFEEILKDSFGVEKVVIVGTRKSDGTLDTQNPKMFHIDQTLVPLADGIIAMPKIEITQPEMTLQELGSLREQALKELAKKWGISNIKDIPVDWSDEKFNQFSDEELKIKDSFDRQRNAISSYQSSIEANNKLEEYRKMMSELGFKIIDLKADVSTLANFQAYTNIIVYKDKNTNEKTVIMPIFPDAQGNYNENEGLNLENKRIFESAGFKVKVVKDSVYKGKGNIHCLILLAQNPQNCPNGCPLSSATV